MQVRGFAGDRVKEKYAKSELLFCQLIIFDY